MDSPSRWILRTPEVVATLVAWLFVVVVVVASRETVDLTCVFMLAI